MDAPMPELLSKGDFAKLINVSAGRVSQYISEGKLSGDALDGEGRRAKIRVVPALAQLRMKLDVGQMMGNGLDTRISAPPTMPAHPAGSELPLQPGPSPARTLPSPDNTEPTIEDRLKQEKLFQARINSRKAAEDEEARKGRFIETDAVKAEMVQLAAKLLDTFEGALPDFANAIAGKFEVPARDVLHLLRGEFRDVRTRAAKNARRDAEEEPETTETEIETSDDG